MKRLLYISFNDLNPSAGVSKKIVDQVSAFRNNGIETNLLAIHTKNGKRTANIDEIELLEINRGLIGKIQIGMLYKKIAMYVETEKVDTLYIRYTQTADPFYLKFLRKCKLYGCRILLEIPTYPYEGEFTGQSASLKAQIIVERLFRNGLRNYVDYVVTTSDYSEILGIQTIKISNAVNASKIPLAIKEHATSGRINLISVATISFWHGLDRIIRGMAIYYSKGAAREVHLTIIGGGDKKTLHEVLDLIETSKMQSHIDYVGPKQGKELDSYYEKADLAVGCLACHRKNIVEVKSLKNVDYAMRGLPMFYSESNSDFDQMPYVLRVPADDSPIDINALVEFVDKLKVTPGEIRKSVSHLTWDEQIKKVIKSVC